EGPDERFLLPDRDEMRGPLAVGGGFPVERIRELIRRDIAVVADVLGCPERVTRSLLVRRRDDAPTIHRYCPKMEFRTSPLRCRPSLLLNAPAWGRVGAAGQLERMELPQSAVE